MNQTQTGLSNWFLGGLLVIIAVFVVVGLILVNSQTEDVTTELSITPEAPSVGTINTVELSMWGDDTDAFSITPATESGLPGEATKYVWAIITDNNGCLNVTAANDVDVAFCRSSNGVTDCSACVGDTDDCYTGGFVAMNCAWSTAGNEGPDHCEGGNDTTVAVSCNFDMANNADYSNGVGDATWHAYMTVTDADGELYTDTGSETDNELDSSIAAGACYDVAGVPMTLNYGALGVGENYYTINSENVYCDLFAYGNQAVDVAVKSSAAMACTIGTIAQGQQQFGLLNDADLDYTLTSSDQAVDLAIADPDDVDPTPTDVLHFDITVPAGVSGTCSGTNVFTFSADTSAP